MNSTNGVIEGISTIPSPFCALGSEISEGRDSVLFIFVLLFLAHWFAYPW